jgi:molybdate transport system substrate-binding protein
MIARNVARAIAALVVAGGAVGHAAEIKVIGGSAVVHVMAELIPSFEQTSGHKVRTDLDGAIGAMTDRVRKGEVADIIIVSGAQIDALIGDRKVAAGSRIDIAKVRIGAFVRKGAPKPDIGSVEAFKRVLISAKSIGPRRRSKRDCEFWFGLERF